jgi:bifunctional non-homologous end joining protein LigD
MSAPADPFAPLSDAERGLLRPAPLPERVEVMKAVLVRTPFSDPEWLFERKLDGIRAVAIKGGGRVRLLSRNDLSLNGRYPEVAEAYERDPGDDLVVDGEVVAFEGSRTSFGRLARRGMEPVPVFHYVFDLLHLSGHDVTALPLRARKRLLRQALAFQDPLRFTPHRNRDGERLLRDACRRGWEGLIAKRVDGPYVHGRSRDWLKLKCEASQELVIGGYTAPRGSREELGALLLGYHRADGAFAYAGKVGTGFDRATLRDLARRLAPLRRETSPFDAGDPPARGTTWVEPELVAQIGFTEWTGDGRLRHPRFLGLRDDKAAREVVRE